MKRHINIFKLKMMHKIRHIYYNNFVTVYKQCNFSKDNLTDNRVLKISEISSIAGTFYKETKSKTKRISEQVLKMH